MISDNPSAEPCPVERMIDEGGPPPREPDAEAVNIDSTQEGALTPQQRRALDRGVPLAADPARQGELNHFFDPDGDGDL